MVTIYTMIAEDKEITLQSHFYQVQVGSTPAAQKALFVLGGHCHKHHYYLAKRSPGDAEFRLKIAASLGVKVYQLPCMVAKVETLVQHLLRQEVLPWQPCKSGNLDYFLRQTSPTYFFNVLQHAQSNIRHKPKV